MRIATLDLTPDLFLEFCKACKQGEPRRFIVKENPLPDDVKLVGMRFADDEPLRIRLVLTSRTFAEVLKGSIPPPLPNVVFETVYDAPDDPDSSYDFGDYVNQ